MARSPANLNLFERAIDLRPELVGSPRIRPLERRGRPHLRVEPFVAVLVDRAVTIPWSTPRYRALVSERVGDVQSHPLWGTLVEQLWVK